MADDVSTAELDAIAARLEELADELNGAGLNVARLPRSDELPLPSLLVQVPPDDDGRERAVALAIIPTAGELDELDLVQLYLPLPVDPRRRRLAQHLVGVNENAVIGHAGIRDGEEVYYRLVWPIPTGLPVLGSVMEELVQLFVFAADQAAAALPNT